MLTTIEDKVYPRESIVDEIKYLRYFYEQVEQHLDWDSNIPRDIALSYKGILPEKYKPEPQEQDGY